MNRWVAAAVAIVVVPLLGYPLVALAGGAPRLPSRDECVHAAVDGMTVDVVFGRFESPVDANAMREHVVEVGFVGTESLPDGCGLWKVVLEGVPSLEIAQEVQDEAGTVGLHPALELDSDG